ncbi:MAG: DUF1036 domain-containing protein [Hyphomicrobiales bacterium]|nr:DUF1036 domain-containing protein [Hyphomicrobiales bacterium]
MESGSAAAKRGGRKVALAVFAAACTSGVALFSTPALADFRVCNATQNLVGVAIGYRAKAGWVTEGWWHIEGSSCKTLIEGPLSSRYYYLYAEDADHGGRWDGSIDMCVADKEFKIAGVNDCFARGFQRAGFKEYDTGKQSSWMVQLTDQPAMSGTAAAAGAGNSAPGNSSSGNSSSGNRGTGNPGSDNPGSDNQ